MFKFIHAADIHLDSPLRGLERYEGAPVERVRGATRDALKNLVQLALDEEVAFVLIAGDLYDGDWQDFNTGLFFSARMSRLREAGVPVFTISGNHDAASRIRTRLRLPDNVRVFSPRKTETVVLDELGVAVHGRSFGKQAVTENLARGYPDAVPDCFNIGLLHTSATGREGHENYAPCSIDDLLLKGYDYWALGHVHQREIIRNRDPVIVYPGNIQGRHIREPGDKGCSLVTVDGRSVTVEHRSLDVLRWVLLAIDAGGAPDAATILDRFRERLRRQLGEGGDRLLALRVQITGESAAHREFIRDPERWTNEIRALATDETRGEAWVEKVLLETTPAIDVDELRKRGGPVRDLLEFVDALHGDEDALNALAEALKPLASRLPREVLEGEEGLDLSGPAGLRRFLDDSRHLLLTELLAGGADE